MHHSLARREVTGKTKNYRKIQANQLAHNMIYVQSGNLIPQNIKNRMRRYNRNLTNQNIQKVINAVKHNTKFTVSWKPPNWNSTIWKFVWEYPLYRSKKLNR